MTDGENKKKEETKKDENHNDDVTPKTNTGDVYASPVTEADISKNNPKDDAQVAINGKGKDTDIDWVKVDEASAPMSAFIYE